MNPIAILTIALVFAFDASRAQLQPLAANASSDSIGVSIGLDLARTLTCGIYSFATKPRSNQNSSSTEALHAIGKVLPSLVVTTEKLAKECLPSSADARRRFRRSFLDGMCPEVATVDQDSNVMAQLNHLTGVSDLVAEQNRNIQSMLRNISRNKV